MAKKEEFKDFKQLAERYGVSSPSPRTDEHKKSQPKWYDADHDSIGNHVSPFEHAALRVMQREDNEIYLSPAQAAIAGKILSTVRCHTPVDGAFRLRIDESSCDAEPEKSEAVQSMQSFVKQMQQAGILSHKSHTDYDSKGAVLVLQQDDAIELGAAMNRQKRAARSDSGQALRG